MLPNYPWDVDKRGENISAGSFSKVDFALVLA